MKKYLSAFVLLFVFSVAAQAQEIGKGAAYIGGSFDYNYDEAGTVTTYTYTTGTTIYSNYHVLNIQAVPDFGYFISDNWAIGMQLGYSRVSGTETNDYIANDNTTNSYVATDNYHTDYLGIGIHVRYYWMLNDKVGIFPQFGVTTANNMSDFSAGTLSVGGNPNIVFFATPNLAINMGFGNLAYTMDYKTKTSTFNAALNTNIGFGLNYYW